MADNGNPKKNAAASIAFAWGKQTALQGTTSRKWTSSIEVNSALSLVLSTIIGKKTSPYPRLRFRLSEEAFRFHSVKKICMVLFPDKHKTVGRAVLEPQLKCQAATSWGLRPHP